MNVELLRIHGCLETKVNTAGRALYIEHRGPRSKAGVSNGLPRGQADTLDLLSMRASRHFTGPMVLLFAAANTPHVVFTARNLGGVPLGFRSLISSTRVGPQL